MGLVTCDIAVSLDGFVAGPHQSAELPMGEGVDGRLHSWMVEQREENASELEAITAAGAFIMGRNMFGPIRGAWEGSWKGWWGPNPPYHGPVFVLTHHAREPLAMDGGTTFTFVTDGIDAALDRARAAAGTGAVSICGGAQTINQYLVVDAIDELRVHLAPVILGAGERLFDGVGPKSFEQAGARQTGLVTHLNYRARR
ncbi:dihydrofolate reductase family protein [Specibacter sp. RAF43]|uniref:dihydrofolate reductase family protein n=1 Tax=Specibacter sp. RAF43 TaxID=3233057 RepID=UPI003F97ACBA